MDGNTNGAPLTRPIRHLLRSLCHPKSARRCRPSNGFHRRVDLLLTMAMRSWEWRTPDPLVSTTHRYDSTPRSGEASYISGSEKPTRNSADRCSRADKADNGYNDGTPFRRQQGVRHRSARADNVFRPHDPGIAPLVPWPWA